MNRPTVSSMMPPPIGGDKADNAPKESPVTSGAPIPTIPQRPSVREDAPHITLPPGAKGGRPVSENEVLPPAPISPIPIQQQAEPKTSVSDAASRLTELTRYTSVQILDRPTNLTDSMQKHGLIEVVGNRAIVSRKGLEVLSALGLL